MKVLFVICGHIHKFLQENDENVIVVNCRAGKGRTGTIVCCYLLFSGRFNSPEDTFIYYSQKRFSKGEGVTQPSQKKYVYYFYQMLQEKIYFPYIRCIKSIILKKVTKNNKEKLIPYFEFYLKNSDKISLSSKCSFLEQKSIPIVKDSVKITDSLFSYWFAGDITIKIFNNGLLSTKKLGRISFNTAFLTKDQTELKFYVNEIDPDNLVKNKKIPKEYQIIVKFDKMCECNNREYPINLCKNCLEFFAMTNELSEWEEIRNVLSLYTPGKRKTENGMRQLKTLLFGKLYWDDVDIVLNDYNKNPKMSSQRLVTNNNKNYMDENEMHIYNFDDIDKEIYNFDESDNSSADSWKKSDFDSKEEELSSSFENECSII